ncbi:MAG: ABC transporter substrate-binding protein [Oscillatoriales cyanobacterium]|nr:MAG: ABC transporter substrate-binding protein [Oscillatoriales cyanobacterium]
MANLSRQLAIASFVAIGLWGCTSGQPSAVSPKQGDSSTRTTAAIAQPSEAITNAKRTVALSSLAADILYQLDPEKLVAVAHDRRVSEHADLSQYPDIGDGREFDVKAIIDLRPDLVVGIAGVHERILTQLEEAGIPTQRYRLDSWDSLFTTIEDLARATSTDPTPLLDRYAALRPASDRSKNPKPADAVESADQSNPEAALDHADRTASPAPTADTDTDTAPTRPAKTTDETTDETTAETTDKATDTTPDATADTSGDTTPNTPKTTASDETEKLPDESSDQSPNESSNQAPVDDADRSSTLILASRDPLFSLNRKSWGGSAIEPFTHNIAAHLDEQRSAAGYVTLDPEMITAADPDTILIVETPGSNAPIAEFESLPFWQDLQAVKNDRVFLVDYYGLIKPATLDDIDATIQQLADIFDQPHRRAHETQSKTDVSVMRRSTATPRPAS